MNGAAPRRIGVVFNPAARAARDQSQRLHRLLRALGDAGHAVETVPTSGPGGGIEAAQRLAPRCDLVLAVGGDGTFCEAAGGLLQASLPSAPILAPVAFGTGNDVALHSGLRQDRDLLDAIEGWANGRLQPVARDVLEVRCHHAGAEVVRHAFLFAGVGIASDILRYTTPAVKRWFGPRLSYAVGFFRALAAWAPSTLRVRTERGGLEESLVVALAANAPHAGGGGMRIAPGALLDDGLAEVSLIRALGRLGMARQFLSLASGRHVEHPRVDYFRSPFLEVDAHPPQPVAADGDVVGHTPVRIRTLHRAIRVLARPGEGTHATGSRPERTPCPPRAAPSRGREGRGAHLGLAAWGHARE